MVGGVLFLLVWQSLNDTQIKVNILEKIIFCQLVVWGLRPHWKVSLEKAMKTSATDPEVLNSSDARSFIIVSILLSPLQSIITSRNKILVYFTEIQKLTASTATATSLIPGLNIHYCHHSWVCSTGQWLTFSGPNVQNIYNNLPVFSTSNAPVTCTTVLTFGQEEQRWDSICKNNKIHFGDWNPCSMLSSCEKVGKCSISLLSHVQRREMPPASESCYVD